MTSERVPRINLPAMARVKIELEEQTIRRIRLIQAAEGISFDEVVSRLLAEALRQRRQAVKSAEFHWVSRSMSALVDLSNKDAIRDAMGTP